MLTVLGGLAEFERLLIRSRTGEGCARARERGVKMGRKPKLTPHQHAEARQFVAPQPGPSFCDADQAFFDRLRKVTDQRGTSISAMLCSHSCRASPVRW
jgi:hypothetical protein